ncbi:MAG TPA: RHS repeat-associated core domain-containing protein [Dehalococcoidia bacterium]|nr:RHS repeat-associated core domain-containing protein [Dehalococcoidia bacterium]
MPSLPGRPARFLLQIVAALGLALGLAAALAALPAVGQSGAPGVPTMVSPAEGSQGNSLTATMSWQQPSGAVAGSTVYSVLLVDAVTGQWLAIQSTTALSYGFASTEGLQYGREYYWTLQACNGGNCSAWARVWGIWTQTPPGAPGFPPLTTPAVGATATGTTPTLAWTAPGGSTSGSTTYAVGLIDAATGAPLAALQPTTATSIAVPPGENLALGHTYDWNVTACNGALCSGYGPWSWFATSSAPGQALQLSPANNSTNVNPSGYPLLSWNQPAGAIYGSTTYTVSVWDPYGDPNGHLLADLAAGTALSVAIPPGEGLLYGQDYYWNVNACTGSSCSGYNNTWWKFTTAPQPPASASLAAQQSVPNGDFGGSPPTSWTTPVVAWTSTAPTQQDPNTWTLTQTTPMTITFPSTCSGGGSCALFHIGYTFPSAAAALFVNWVVGGSATQAYADYGMNYGSYGTWLEAVFGIPSTAASPGSVQIALSSGAQIAYLERTDVPSAHAIPRVGLAAEARFPKVTSAFAGAGVDTVTGAFGDAAADLSLAGLSGPLGFSRAYHSQALIAPMATGTLPAPLGNRWTHNWQASLMLLNAGGAIVRTPGGGAYSFSGSGPYTPPKGVGASLVSGGAGVLVLTTADQMQYVFSNVGAGGGVVSGAAPPWPLTAVKDRNGNTTALSYDGQGRLTTIADANGRSLSLSYQPGSPLIQTVSDNAGRTVSFGYTATSAGGDDLTSVTNVLGGVTHYTYTTPANGDWLAQITDPLGHVVLTNSYDGSARVATQQDGAGGTITYHYQTPNAGITQVVDQRGQSWTYYFNAALCTTDVVSPAGVRASWTYDSDNNAMSSANTQSVTGAYTYDTRGNRLTSEDALDYITTSTYDSFNDVLTVTDPKHGVTTNTFNAYGNLTSTRNAGGNTTSYTVNSLGQVTAVTTARGFTTQFGYTNSYHDRTTVTDPWNLVTSTGYDAVGRVTSVTDPLNHTTSYSYTLGSGETDKVIDALGDTTTTTLNAAGQTASVQDPDGHTTSYAYEGRGLLHTVTDARGGVTTYGYDAGGNRTSVQDANGSTTSYTFNADGQALTVTDPLARTLLTFSYDTVGRTATRRDGRGLTTSYGYDARNLLTSVQYASGAANVAYGYDALGNRTSMADSTGTTSYQYDALSRLTSVTFPGNRTVQDAYDADNNRTTIYYSGSQRPVSYTYDQFDRLSTVTDWTGAVFSYYWDNAGRSLGVVLPSSTGIASTLAYDNANRVTGICWYRNSTCLTAANYTLDAAGNRTNKTLTGSYLPAASTGTESYTLDPLNRLTSAAYPNGGGTTSYSYDAVGNRLSLTTAAGTTSYAYDHADQLLSVTPPGQGAISYAYDPNGNQTARGADSFSWDAENRLTAATVAGQGETNTYNGDGLRQSRTAGGNTKSFVWDVGNTLPVLLDDGSQYVYGLGLISRVIGNQTYYYLTDGLGSTLAVVDSAGTLQQSYAYDVFGAVTSQSSSLGSEPQFAGQETDPDGLQYLRARFYDPATGRFLSRDPSPGCVFDPAHVQPYVYAGDDPVGAVDPSGLCQVSLGHRPLRGVAYEPTAEVSHLAVRLYDPTTKTTTYCEGYADNGPSGVIAGNPGNVYGQCGGRLTSPVSEWQALGPDDGGSCDAQLDAINAYYRELRAANVPYDVLNANSNTVAYYTLISIGISPPDLGALFPPGTPILIPGPLGPIPLGGSPSVIAPGYAPTPTFAPGRVTPMCAPDPYCGMPIAQSP